MHFGTKGLPGGVLRPRKAKHLALPFPGITGRPRSYQNTFFQKSKKGNLIMFQNQDDGSIIPLFVLKESVKIPARPFITLRPKTLDEMAKKAAWYLTVN